VDDALLRDGFDPRFDAPIHNSRRGIFLLSGTKDREMHASNDFPHHEAVHALARKRYDTDPAYRPKNLPAAPVISPSSIADVNVELRISGVAVAQGYPQN
jgi:hypothetical protein